MTATRADERMSDVDALVWNVERRPRNRTTIAALVRFDEPLDVAELRHRVDRASRVIPRLRQRVIHDPLGLAARWSIDPDFRLSTHLRAIRLSEGTDQRLAEVVRDLIVQPFDRAHPLWEFTLISGLDDGGVALLLKSHHAVSDGVGGVEMMLELFDFQPEPLDERRELPAAPTAPLGPTPLTSTMREELTSAIAGARQTIGQFTAPRTLAEAVAAGRRLGETCGSAVRMLEQPAVAPAVPAARSDDLDVRFFSVSLQELRDAGRRFDGTVNDAFVTAIALGVADHFGHTPASPLSIAVPINTRQGDDSVGNHWAPGHIHVDLAGANDIAALMSEVKSRMRRVRHEPAHRLVEPLAAGLRRLPPSAAASLFTRITSGYDVAASNVPGSPTPLYLCGREVVAMVPFGPLSGCAINVTLLSHAGVAHIGVSTDPAVVGDPDELHRNLAGGFTAVAKGS